MEMHVVHTPLYKRNDEFAKNNKGYIYAVLGVFFDTDPMYKEGLAGWQIRNIDAFFESMTWTETTKDPKVSEVKFADFLQMVDTDNRWTYEGSLTTPPCSNSVNWNVLRRVYPIKAMHLDQFRNQLARQKAYQLTHYGNYRMV